tara:strand:- start:26263 stop:26466 length:204 start_codon:yes stop_codon:yes gene_type:complete
MQSGFVESFSGKMRDECLNETLFASLHQTNVALAEWKHDCSTIRPHSALGGKLRQKLRSNHVRVPRT